VRTSHVWLKRLLNGEALYPELPWLYTGGFASIDLGRNALDENGKFFRSRIPDVYSAIALASVTKNTRTCERLWHCLGSLSTAQALRT
jgi:hypothetical protein